jgi:hypothetical protein
VGVGRMKKWFFGNVKQLISLQQNANPSQLSVRAKKNNFIVS